MLVKSLMLLKELKKGIQLCGYAICVGLHQVMQVRPLCNSPVCSSLAAWPLCPNFISYRAWKQSESLK